MRKKFREVLERTEKIKKKSIDRTFYYSESKLKMKVKEEEQLNMSLRNDINNKI